MLQFANESLQISLEQSPGNDVRVCVQRVASKSDYGFQTHPHIHIHEPHFVHNALPLPFSAFNNNVPCTSSNIHKWMRWCFAPNRNEFVSKERTAHICAHTQTLEMEWNEMANESGASTVMPGILYTHFMAVCRSHWDEDEDFTDHPIWKSIWENLVFLRQFV